MALFTHRWEMEDFPQALFLFVVFFRPRRRRNSSLSDDIVFFLGGEWNDKIGDMFSPSCFFQMIRFLTHDPTV